MKNLKRNDLNVVVSEISRRVNEKNLVKIEKELSKDKNYKKLKKLVDERDELNKKVGLLNVEVNNMVNLIREDKKVYLYNNGKICVNNNVGFNGSNLYNEIMIELMEENGGGIKEVIERMVEKYSE